MAFNVQRFMEAKLEPRRSKVAVEALAAFFDDGQPAVWEVRGLNSVELHKALEAGKRQANVEQIVAAIAAKGDVAQAVRKALGLTNDTPGEIAKRLEMLVMGSVSPEIDLPGAVRLSESYPIEFLMLTNEISELTGKGFDVVKPEAASETIKASTPA